MELSQFFEATGIYNKIKINLANEQERKILQMFDSKQHKYRVFLKCLYCGCTNSFEIDTGHKNNYVGLDSIGVIKMMYYSFGIEQSSGSSHALRFKNFDNNNELSYKGIRNEIMLDVEFRCTHDGSHYYKMNLHFFQNENLLTLQKIGQFPSPYEFMHTNIYDETLKTIGALDDYRKSIETTSYSYYVASFTYSRRVIEKLIMFEYLKDKDRTKEDYFRINNFSDKIMFAKGIIDPDLMDSFSPLYKVLSKGIHSLDDAECKKYFSVLHNLVNLQLEFMRIQSQQAKHKKRIISDLGGLK